MEIFKINRYIILLVFSIACARDEPLTADQVIQLAEENNSDLRQLREKLLLDDLKQSVYEKRYFPKLSPISIDSKLDKEETFISTGAVMNLPSGGKATVSYNNNLLDTDQKYSLNVSQPLLKNTANISDQIKQLDINIERNSMHKQYQSIILSILKTYRSCVLTTLSAEQQEKTINDLHAELATQRIKFENGEISENELNKSMYNIEKQTLDLIKQEKSTELALIELKQMIGLDPLEPLTINTSISYQDMTFDPAVTISSARNKGIDSEIAKLKHQRAKLMNKKNKKEFEPELSVYGSIDQDNKTSTGLRLSFRAPDADEQLLKTQNTLDYMQAEQEYKQFQNKLSTSIHQALINLQHQRELIHISEKALKNAQDIYHSESIKFNYSEISDQDLHKAAKELNSAYHDSINMQFEYCNQRDALLIQIGQFDNVIHQLGGHHNE